MKKFLGESQSKVYDHRENYKSETHNVDMYIDEENATNITEREFEASMCETEQEHINSQGLNCNMEGADDSESHHDDTHVDDDYKEICELVNLVVVDEFGEVGIVNEHFHAQISHHRVDEHYVYDMHGFFFETRIDCGNMVSSVFYE